jgi:hypothetical protein
MNIYAIVCEMQAYVVESALAWEGALHRGRSCLDEPSHGHSLITLVSFRSSNSAAPEAFLRRSFSDQALGTRKEKTASFSSVSVPRQPLWHSSCLFLTLKPASLSGSAVDVGTQSFTDTVAF